MGDIIDVLYILGFCFGLASLLLLHLGFVGIGVALGCLFAAAMGAVLVLVFLDIMR